MQPALTNWYAVDTTWRPRYWRWTRPSANSDIVVEACSNTMKNATPPMNSGRIAVTRLRSVASRALL